MLILLARIRIGILHVGLCAGADTRCNKCVSVLDVCRNRIAVFRTGESVKRLIARRLA